LKDIQAKKKNNNNSNRKKKMSSGITRSVVDPKIASTYYINDTSRRLDLVYDAV